MLAQKFEEQVNKTPGNIAIKSRDQTLTYRELNREANRIARMIWASAGNDIVGLLFDHGLHMVAAILGALKAGKIYVPLSVDYPPRRLAYMLSDSEASLIVTGTSNKTLAQKLGKDRNIPVVDIETNNNEPVDPGKNPSTSIPGEKIAYIMYTSGSTGRPKGVIQNHQNVLYYTRNWVRTFSISAGDKMTLITSLCHDGSVQDIFSALLTGAALFPFAVKKQEKAGELIEFLQEEKITIWHSVPTLFRYFVNTLTGGERFPGLRFILLGGEIVREHDFDMVKKYFPGSRLAAIYGQTESSVNSILFIREKHRDNKPLLGTPLEGTRMLVVDDEGNPVKPLRSGEILAASHHISPGYWKNPEATREVFDSDRELGRLYWTGDMGRLLVDGSIEFLGRRDSQVKIRGFRIEPGEIETRLLRSEYIKEAVVIPYTGDKGETFLSAYFVAAGDGKSEKKSGTAELREYLARELPDYMIPAYFTQLQHIPLTASGKVDRQALPLPHLRVDREYAPPTDEIEEKLVDIWARVLQVEKSTLSVNDSFFELGGHSLSAMIIIARIHKTLDISVPLMEIFKTPHIRGLARYIKTGFKDQRKYSPIPAVEKKEYHILSPAQKRLYIMQIMDPGGTSYNMPGIYILKAEIQRKKLKDTFNLLIEKHESLRTSFIFVKEKPVQKIHDIVEFEIENYRDKVEDNEGTRGLAPLFNESPTALISSFIRPFDLSGAPLLRVAVAKLENGKHLLMVDMHHIISDALSHRLLVKDFIAGYTGASLSELRIQYKDYSEWYERIHTNENKKITPAINNIKTQRDYWLKEFAGEIPELNLPTDFLRPAVQDFFGQNFVFEVEVDKVEAMKKLALEKEVTPFMVIMAVYTIMMGKLSGQEDIIVGTTTAGRNHTDLDQIVGMFVNTLAIRNTIEPGKTFLQLLTEVKEKVLKAFENQDYPFEDLVEQVAVNRNVSRNPLFDVMFSFIAGQAGDEKTAAAVKDNLKIQPYPYENRTAKFDLTLYGTETAAGLIFTCEYRTKLFKTGTIERFIRYFRNILFTIIENPGVKPGEIRLISSEEKRQIVYDFNNTAVDYPREKTIHQLFAEQVERTPDRTAIVGPSRMKYRTYMTYKTYISYRELNNQSDRLARILTGKGIQPETIVAIMAQRSIEMIIGILGILKAGGAYLPIDPDYPQERKQYMLKDSAAEILLTSDAINRVPTSPSFSTSTSASTCQVGSANLAYVIYTSGSTGRPKGVMIEHRALHNFIAGMAGLIDFKPGKIILALTTITFDIFGLETLLPLCLGLKLVLADENHQREMALLEQLIVKNCVDMVQATPSRMQMFTMTDGGRSSLKNLKELMVGGEALPLQLLAELKQSTPAKMYNMYGPTETTIWSTVKELNAAEEINIGTPIQNTVIYILDKHNHIQPLGVPGELCIGGDGLARGYINRPQLTADRFYRSYKSYTSYKSPIYRTGDLASWQPDGNIKFLGRIDHQVKIRGYRIEPEEIEELLLKHEQIKEAVVVIKNDTGLDKSLCAYLLPDTTASTSPPNPADLREMMADKLPAYMIPSYFVMLEKMPLTPNGKIDRKYLIESGPSYTRTETAVTFVEPATDLEKTITRIWKEILQIEEIGIHDNFFDLGGNSMKLIRLSRELKDAFGIEIPVALMFRNLTVNFLSKHLAPKEIETGKNIKQAEALERARNTFKDTIGKLLKE